VLEIDMPIRHLSRCRETDTLHDSSALLRSLRCLPTHRRPTAHRPAQWGRADLPPVLGGGEGEQSIRASRDGPGAHPPGGGTAARRADPVARGHGL